MKAFAAGLAVTISLAMLGGCYSGDSAREERKTPGEIAGQAAYDIQKGAKKASKEISKDLKSFGHDAREGYHEEKAKESVKHPVDPDAR
jgi:hypothetical protein